MRVRRLLLAACVLQTFAVFAEGKPLATVGDLSEVQSETIMFDAQAMRAEAKAKMQESAAKAGDDPQFAKGQSSPSVAVVAADLPTVTGISGAAGRLYATFRYANGTTVTSKSGESIAGGFQVAEVGIDRVVLTRGDRRIPLQFGVSRTPPQQSVPVQSPGFNAPLSPPALR
ncbi:type IV pilus biogenesis protein PilP [Pseudomonas koreensis]